MVKRKHFVFWKLLFSSTLLNDYEGFSYWKHIKGVLRYKTITSLNVSLEVLAKKLFISLKNYVPFSRYSTCIFNHPMIYQICDVMMSIVHETGCTFWTIEKVGAKFQVLFNLATFSNYSITNYVKIPVFHFSGKLDMGQSKILKMARSHYTVILIKS